jgi:Ca2+-transporting ATPase
MITGDHKDTAVAIAKQLGIIEDDSAAITGAQLDEISDEDFAEAVKEFRVYARVQPEHKTRIVNAWRAQGMITAMTGDGVNDAPSIKSADIGVGMGITGTDVTKNVADMVLADDNFATIVSAVSEGRRIYDNIRKAIQFLLGSNLSEVLSIFTATILGFTILKPVHLLFINLVTDSIPALALGLERPERDIMQRKPKAKNEGIFAGGLGVRVVLQGIMFAALTLIGFKAGEAVTGQVEGGQTLSFMVLALCQIVQSFNMRSEYSLFKIGPFKNKTLNGAAAISTLLMAVVMFTPLRILFGLIILPAKLYLLGVILIFVPLFVMEIAKLSGLVKR